MFPGLKVERATEAPFIIESVTPAPMREPRFRIFEMDSMPEREVHRYGQFPPRPVAVVVEADRIFRETPWSGGGGVDPVNTAYEEAQEWSGESLAGLREIDDTAFTRNVAVAHSIDMRGTDIKITTEFTLPGGGTAQDIGQGEDDLQVFWPEARKRELLGLLGVPKEFLEGPTNFSSSGMALRCGSVMGAFGAEYQQEVQGTPHCATCGHAIDFHYRKNDPDKRLGPCRGHHTECECTRFEERES
jgi:hypothetical protein